MAKDDDLLFKFLKSRKIVKEYDSKKIGTNLRNHFEPYYTSLKTEYAKFKKSKFVVERLKYLKKDTPIISGFPKAIEILNQLLKNQTLMDNFIKILELLLIENENLILIFPVFDRELYYTLFGFYRELPDTSKNYAKKEIEFLLNSLKDRINANTIIKSMLIYQKLSLNFFNRKDLIKSFENLETKDYEQHISDFALKFAQLIEGPLKANLKILLILKKITNNEDHKDFIKKNYSVGSILYFLRADQTLSKYRNAIFHHQILVKDGINMDNREIVLNDRKKQITLTLEEFIDEFYKTITFNFTCTLVFLLITLMSKPSIKDTLNQIFEFIKDAIDKILNTTFGDLMEKKEN